MAVEKLQETPTLKYLKKLKEAIQQTFEELEEKIDNTAEDIHRIKQSVDNIESLVLEISDKLAESPTLVDVQAKPQLPNAPAKETKSATDSTGKGGIS